MGKLCKSNIMYHLQGSMESVNVIVGQFTLKFILELTRRKPLISLEKEKNTKESLTEL